MIGKNLGKTEIFIRLLLGIILVIFAISMSQGTIQVVVATLGVILLLTGIFSFCPFYSMLGVSSRENRLDKITKNDIKKAIKEYKHDEETPKDSTKVDVKTSTSKKSSKKSTKKAAKKTTKKATKKAVKKTAKKSTKKTAKKTIKKAAKKVAN